MTKAGSFTIWADLNPGDRKVEDRFKAISAAYDLLSDLTSGPASTEARSTFAQVRARP
jgi:hypothetical protein